MYQHKKSKLLFSKVEFCIIYLSFGNLHPLLVSVPILSSYMVSQPFFVFSSKVVRGQKYWESATWLKTTE